MNVAITKRGNDLFVSVPSALTDSDLARLSASLVKYVHRVRPRGVVIDIAGLDVMDSFATRTFGDLAAKIRGQGAEMMLVGIQPDVAVAALRLGLSLDSMAAVLGYQEDQGRAGDLRTH